MFNISFNQRYVRKQLGSERPRLYRMALAWCGDRSLADDLVQQAMTKALERSHQLKDIKAFRGWLYRIMNNGWHDYLRGMKPETEFQTDMLVCENCPDSEFETGEMIDAVRKAVCQLPLGQKEVLTLVDLEGFSYKEVAEILSIPTGTVMSRLSRSRKKLEQIIMKNSAMSTGNVIPLRRKQ